MAIVKNTPIGLKLPLRNGTISGYFDQSFDSFTTYRMNIINLLRTSPGERRMNPAFGCRLWSLVFEPNDDLISTKVKNIIKEDIARWIPGVTVSSIEIETTEPGGSSFNVDIYKLHILVTFVIDSINQDDVVEIDLNINKV
jgi:phage baseplate assembly protein W